MPYTQRQHRFAVTTAAGHQHTQLTHMKFEVGWLACSLQIYLDHVETPGDVYFLFAVFCGYNINTVLHDQGIHRTTAHNKNEIAH